MTCEEAIKKLYEYLDKELDRSASEQLDRHLDICRVCCDHFEFERKMKTMVQDSCFQEKAPLVLKLKIMDNLSPLD
jgi:mycothiol system anti-sigma-R factor